MGCTRREFLALASVGTVAGVAACTPQQDSPHSPSNVEHDSEAADASKFKELAIDSSAWSYDEENDVYYQLGLAYCLEPETETYETLAIFVPGAYFTAEKNGETYTCQINDRSVVGNFTASRMPGASTSMPVFAAAPRW